MGSYVNDDRSDKDWARERELYKAAILAGLNTYEALDWVDEQMKKKPAIPEPTMPLFPEIIA